VAVAILDTELDRLAHRQRGQPPTGNVAKRLATLGNVNVVLPNALLDLAIVGGSQRIAVA
jgi:hypothetical protein